MRENVSKIEQGEDGWDGSGNDAGIARGCGYGSDDGFYCYANALGDQKGDGNKWSYPNLVTDDEKEVTGAVRPGSVKLRTSRLLSGW